jgi:hypothetical protein
MNDALAIEYLDRRFDFIDGQWVNDNYPTIARYLNNIEPLDEYSMLYAPNQFWRIAWQLRDTLNATILATFPKPAEGSNIVN